MMRAIHRTPPPAPTPRVKQARFDPLRFNWIGRLVQETASYPARSDDAYKKAQDLVTAKQRVKFAAKQLPSDLYIVPLTLNNEMGAVP